MFTRSNFKQPKIITKATSFVMDVHLNECMFVYMYIHVYIGVYVFINTHV